LDASWEIDLFGARAKAAEAAGARWQAREADWHVTRVSLAAEVAATLVDYRACRVSADILVQDLQSREAVARLTAEALKTGYMPRAEGFLSDASAASARERLIAQRAECDLDVKALVALTGLSEADLRTRLDAPPVAATAATANATPGLPRPAALVVESVPAQVLAQRPDIAAAERELAAAAAEINVAEAQRYPSLSLRGSIGVGRLSSGGVSGSADTWSFGPASLSLPLFDGGRRRAAVAEAQGRYDEQAGVYRQRVRDAVREIEEALVRLDAAARRETDADIAAREYQRYFQAGDEKFRAGASNMLDLEEARRNSLSARLTQVGVQRERVQAWIALYKALGGGWQPATLPATASAATTTNAGTATATTVNAGAAAPRL
ncbi:MAG: efflux transporter outer membrane subunit, partial [Duganella sp.]